MLNLEVRQGVQIEDSGAGESGGAKKYRVLSSHDVDTSHGRGLQKTRVVREEMSVQRKSKETRVAPTKGKGGVAKGASSAKLTAIEGMLSDADIESTRRKKDREREEAVDALLLEKAAEETQASAIERETNDMMVLNRTRHSHDRRDPKSNALVPHKPHEVRE